jgi:hypothetical protein
MSGASYLDLDVMAGLDAQAFRNAHPYPWLTPAAFLTSAGYARLVETLPSVDLFAGNFGHKRKYGQQSHDRYALVYRPDLPVAAPWHEFVAELLGPEYQRFIQRLFGVRRYRLMLHWHYTPRGCVVSPHCDAKRKLGSQIFYFNTASDWQESWGGQTLVLDDHGRLKSDSAPAFEDFEEVAASRALGNNSMLFMRRGHSWHGVKPLTCPEQALRKVFIVVIEDWSLPWQLVNLARGRVAPGFQPTMAAR